MCYVYTHLRSNHEPPSIWKSSGMAFRFVDINSCVIGSKFYIINKKFCSIYQTNLINSLLMLVNKILLYYNTYNV